MRLYEALRPPPPPRTEVRGWSNAKGCTAKSINDLPPSVAAFEKHLPPGQSRACVQDLALGQTAWDVLSGGRTLIFHIGMLPLQHLWHPCAGGSKGGHTQSLTAPYRWRSVWAPQMCLYSPLSPMRHACRG